MATALFGGGAKVERAQTATAGSTDWQEITEVIGDITPPGGTKERVDKTSHTSVRTVGKRKQYGAGLADTSNFRFQINFDPADAAHAALLADWEAGTVRDYLFTRADQTTKIKVRGEVGTFQETDPISGFVRCDIEIFPDTVDFTA
jgi:hypothetical protein